MEGATFERSIRRKGVATGKRGNATLRGSPSRPRASASVFPRGPISIAQAVPRSAEELEGMLALIYNDECVGVQVPTAVQLRITQCDPGVRGNSATGRTKPATLETGLIVQVPEYLSQDEVIKVDTRTGAFLSRA